LPELLENNTFHQLLNNTGRGTFREKIKSFCPSLHIESLGKKSGMEFTDEHGERSIDTIVVSFNDVNYQVSGNGNIGFRTQGGAPTLGYNKGKVQITPPPPDSSTQSPAG